MSEATPIQPKDDKEDHSLEVSMTLSDLAAVGELLTVIGTQELCNDTIRDLGYFINRHATRIDELLYGGAK